MKIILHFKAGEKLQFGGDLAEQRIAQIMTADPGNIVRLGKGGVRILRRPFTVTIEIGASGSVPREPVHHTAD